MTCRARRGFTLVEILIVVVILGILASIVVASFATSSQDAANVQLRQQLRVIRGQMELYLAYNAVYPDLAANGWTDMTDGNPSYFQDRPRNVLRNGAYDVVSGTGVPPQASGAGATDAWYWNTDELILYAIDIDGNIIEP